MKKVVFKRTLSLLMTMMLILSFFGTASASDDLKGHWAESEMKEWVQKGLLKGFSDGALRPNSKISRAEFVTLINRTFEFKGTSTSGFADVSPKDWYYGEFLKAKSAGYLSGYEDGTIRPQDPITRQEQASILARLLKLGSASEGVNGFKDKEAIPSWSRGAIGTVFQKGFMVGFEDGTFKPSKKVTRAEAIVSLNRVLKSEFYQSQKTSVIYDKAGTFGPATDKETIRGNVSISSADVTLQNTVIEGNLTIEKSVGNGNVYLKGVTVKGKTIVAGGGENSIHFEDTVLLTVIVNKVDGTVRIVASGKTTIQQVELQSSAKVEEINATGAGFQAVTLASSLPVNAKVSLLGEFDSVDVKATTISVSIPKGSIKELQVDKNAKGTSIDIAKDAKIVSLVVNAAINVLGTGKIETATVNVNGATFQQKPDKVELANGVTITPGQPSAPAPSIGGGGGSGSGGGGTGSTPSNDTSPPTFKGEDVELIDGSIIVIPFNERIVKNITNLKDGIRISYNGGEYEGLSEDDTVVIGTATDDGDHRNRLIIYLAEPLYFEEGLRVKVLGNTIKDEVGNVQTKDLVTRHLGMQLIEIETAFSDGGVIPDRHSFAGDNISLPVSWTPVEGAKSYVVFMYDEDAYYGGGPVTVASANIAVSIDETEVISNDEEETDNGENSCLFTTLNTVDDTGVYEEGEYSGEVPCFDFDDTEFGYFLHWFVKDIPAVVTSIEEGWSRTENMLGVELYNSFCTKGYGGPEPPFKHTYILAVVALNVESVEFDIPKGGPLNPKKFNEVILDKAIGFGMITGVFGPDVSDKTSTISQTEFTVNVDEEFTFEITVRDDSDNHSPILGLTKNDFEFTSNGEGYFEVVSFEPLLNEEGLYRVTATYDTAETANIMINVRGVSLSTQLTLTIDEPLKAKAYTYDNDNNGFLDHVLIYANKPIKSDTINLSKFQIHGKLPTSFSLGEFVDDESFWLLFEEDEDLTTGAIPNITILAEAFDDMNGNSYSGMYGVEVIDFAAPVASIGELESDQQLDLFFSEKVKSLFIDQEEIASELINDNTAAVLIFSKQVEEDYSFTFTIVDEVNNKLEYKAVFKANVWKIDIL